MVLRVTRQIIEVLSDAPSGVTLEKSAANTLSLTQSVGDFLNESASNTLVPTQAATGEITEFIRTASSSLTLTQVLAIIGPISVSAESLIALSQVAHAAQEIEVSPQNTIALTQSTVASGDMRVSAENTITFIQKADTTDKFRTIQQSIALSQAAVGVASKTASNILILSQLALVVTETQNVVQAINLTQEAAIPFDTSNTLELVQEAIAIPPDPVRTISPQLLDLTQAATVVTSSTKAFSNTLAIVQAVAYTLERSSTLCDYSPFIGTNSDPNAPAPPPATLPAPNTPGFVKGIQLRHPSGGSPTDVVNIDHTSMNIGDIDRIEFDRIIRETRGGTLEVFADPIWPKTEKLLFTVSNVKAGYSQLVIDFIEAHVGQEIGLLTHEGRLWSGVVMNPSESVVQDGKDRYTINIEFEGVED